MASHKIYDLAVVTGQYPDGNGGMKNRYQTVGAVMEKDDGGKFIMLERWFNPAGVPNPDNRGSVLLSMFEPRPKDGQQQAPQQRQQAPQQQAPQQQRRPAPPADSYDDDIPF